MSSKKRSCNSQQYDVFSEYSHRSNSTKSLFGISFEENPEQRELIRLMNERRNVITYCFGKAGTGKTFTALAAALDLVKVQRKYRKIFYIREPLEVGKSLGYLPGTLDEKYGVYCDGMTDNLEAICGYSGLNINDLTAAIECIPPQFTRGRSFQDSIILVDEAQNLSFDSIHTLLTRLGKFSKIVLLGSVNQIDVKGKTKEDNDFVKSYNLLKEAEDFPDEALGCVELVKSERSDYCAIIDEIFTNYKENLKK